MNKSQVSVLVKFVTEGAELFQAFKDATEDGKIRLFEWINIARESGDVFEALKAFKGFQIESITSEEIEEVTDVIFDQMDGELKFTKEQCIYILTTAKYFTLSIKSFVK